MRFRLLIGEKEREEADGYKRLHRLFRKLFGENFDNPYRCLMEIEKGGAQQTSHNNCLGRKRISQKRNQGGYLCLFVIETKGKKASSARPLPTPLGWKEGVALHYSSRCGGEG